MAGAVGEELVGVWDVRKPLKHHAEKDLVALEVNVQDGHRRHFVRQWLEKLPATRSTVIVR